MGADLHGITDKIPDADTVAMVETLLADVKSGRVRGVAFATVDCGGCVSSAWSGEFERDIFRGIGSLENLKLRLWESREIKV